MRRVEPIKIARTIDLIDVAFVPIFAQFFEVFLHTFRLLFGCRAHQLLLLDVFVDYFRFA